MNEKKFPDGFYWGEKVRGTLARPCLQLCEYLEQSGDKVYRACKASHRGTGARPCLVFSEYLEENTDKAETDMFQKVASCTSSDNLNRICKIYSACKAQHG